MSVNENLLDDTIMEIQHVLEDYMDFEYNQDLYEAVMNPIEDILKKFLEDLKKDDHDWNESIKDRAKLYNENAKLREQLSIK